MCLILAAKVMKLQRFLLPIIPEQDIMSSLGGTHTHTCCHSVSNCIVTVEFVTLHVEEMPFRNAIFWILRSGDSKHNTVFWGGISHRESRGEIQSGESKLFTGQELRKLVKVYEQMCMCVSVQRAPSPRTDVQCVCVCVCVYVCVCVCACV
jgi:hypothetical protein